MVVAVVEYHSFVSKSSTRVYLYSQGVRHAKERWTGTAPC